MNPTTFFQSTSVPGDVSGTVPATLSLTVTPSATLGSFTPGIARDYATSLGAGVISTGADATLAVTDTSATAPGRLVNGAFALAQPLQSRVAPAAFAPISRQPADAEELPGPGEQRQRDGRPPAVDRLERAAAHRHVLEGADLHAVDDDPMTA